MRSINEIEMIDALTAKLAKTSRQRIGAIFGPKSRRTVRKERLSYQWSTFCLIAMGFLQP